VSGMTPKITCPQCGSALTRTDKVCPSCGVAVNWADAGLPAEDISQKERQENKSQRKNSSPGWTSKSVIGAIAVIAIAVLAYELWVEKRPGVDVVSQQARQQKISPMQLPAEVQELEKSVAANPDDMSLTLQLANSLHDLLMFDKAVPYYKTYLLVNPKDADARVDLGICYKELGNFRDAKNEMLTALRYVPKHLFAHFNIGIVCLSEGNIEEANTWFKKTVALDPGSEVGKRAQQLLTQHNSQTTKQK
jgi:tetratricopeptide (TPR) repeat protein